MVSGNFNDYIQSFSQARTLNRHHHFYLGPTNSGKTYAALQALQQAESGVYLAPLRLLAMEVRDRLMMAGVPCNLITGEERVLISGARHTASTIEMLNTTKLVDVAVIDEIQMLQDPDRGSAWTTALVGVPAKTVFICGSNAVTQLCVRAIETMQESYDITFLERKTPLMLEEKSLCGKRYGKTHLKSALQKGDTLIAFSRKDVLTLSARLKHWGFSVASIYGALSPEIRRAESERFLTGQADILVATDAIGMGLNLPIRRVIFTQIHKFDGAATRALNATEVRQIAGRAGRFGLYDTGYVNVMEDDEQLHIAHMLQTSDIAELDKLPVSLNFSDLHGLATKLHSKKLAEILEFHHSRFKAQHDLFCAAPLVSQIAQALLIDAYAPDMALKDKFIFACAPTSLNVPFEKDYYLQCLASVYHATARRLPPMPDWVLSDNPKHLEAAELLSQNLSLYAWLAFKFPQIFTESEKIVEYRSEVSRYIQRALRTQTGYGDTSRESEHLPKRPKILTRRKY